MARLAHVPVHLVVGGFPPGASAAHDIEYARRRLLGFLAEHEQARTTVSSDLADIERWLERSRFVITYLSGPQLDEQQSLAMQAWLEAGGRWFGLHGTSGGRAAPVDGDRRRRRMVKTSHHEVLGAFFLNHPPVSRFRVDVADRDHPLARLTLGYVLFPNREGLHLLFFGSDARVGLRLAKNYEGFIPDESTTPCSAGVYHRRTPPIKGGATFFLRPVRVC